MSGYSTCPTKQDVTTTKERMVFDASKKPHPLAYSVNECMFTGPPLQPLLWDIMVRAIPVVKAFLAPGCLPIPAEEHLRFTRVPFGAEASPLMLGAIIQYHIVMMFFELFLLRNISELNNNTVLPRPTTNGIGKHGSSFEGQHILHVDNVMQTGSDLLELEKFKREATEVLESGKFLLHKWELKREKLDTDEVEAVNNY